MSRQTEVKKKERKKEKRLESVHLEGRERRWDMYRKFLPKKKKKKDTGEDCVN